MITFNVRVRVKLTAKQIVALTSSIAALLKFFS